MKNVKIITFSLLTISILSCKEQKGPVTYLEYEGAIQAQADYAESQIIEAKFEEYCN